MLDGTTTKPKSGRPRVRLNPDSAARELIILLKGITDDGKISDEEVGWLRNWAENLAVTEHAGVRRLQTTVLDVTRDGMVTDAEREFLYTTIAGILPTEDANIAKFRKRQAKQSEKEERNRIAQEEKERERAIATANSPVDFFDVPVVGVRYEGRDKIVAAHDRESMSVFLVRDRNNTFSAHAVAVILNDGSQIGFVPDEDARDIAGYLDRVMPYTAIVKKLWVAQSDGAVVPILKIEFFGTDCQLQGLTHPSTAPKPIFSREMQSFTAQPIAPAPKHRPTPVAQTKPRPILLWAIIKALFFKKRR